MKVLVIGAGGREHALCWKIAASPLCDKLYCAPGNAGIAQVAECVAVGVDDFEGLIALATDKAIDFVVVGPEGPLVAGLADRLTEQGVKVFGPSRAAAMLEGSKGFLKDLCAKYEIPTAEYGRLADPKSAKSFVRESDLPVVIKADGLAAGKGVVIARTMAEAEATIDAMMVEKTFGAAGTSLVIEEFLEGEEVSFFALVDGKNILPLGSAQDHKQVGEGETGPNTGGMGAYSPAPVMTPKMQARVMSEIIEPTVRAMADEGQPFKGVLFAGLMITTEGPMLIEHNVRFGDPECQVLCMRLESDLLPALIATCDGTLDSLELRWREESAISVVMAARGYPGAYQKGTEIRGLDKAGAQDGVVIFHAGTKAEPGGRLIATGGRALSVTATGRTISEAKTRAYNALDLIDWPEGFCRRDIAWRALPLHN